MKYRILENSRRIEKRFLEIINIFSKEKQKTILQILLNDPKGNEASHWKIKKVYKDIWQLDLPHGYRLEYTVLDKEHYVLVLFIGNHNDAAAYLQTKK